MDSIVRIRRHAVTRMIRELRRPPIGEAHEPPFQGPKGGATPKDVKYEGRSGNVYENKGSTDTTTGNYSGFCPWFAPFLQKWTRIQRAFWPITHKTDDDWGEVWTPIGSPANRVTGPAPQHGVALRWADDPMTRWVDHLAFPLCTSKQKGLV
jgi:hypothetical protein